MRFNAAAVSIAFLACNVASGFELNEQLLGLADVPYKVGHLLSSDEVAALKCTASSTDLLVCPIPTREARGFSMMLAKVDSGFRVSSVLSYWKCEQSACPEAIREAVAALSKVLGAQPEQLDGVPIWKDRELNQRDLMVTKVGSNMVGIVLLESK